MNINELQTWYLKNQRQLSFRNNRDPYRIWISEIMAQQTQIETMLKYYDQWMQKWPDLQSLSQASLADILSMWEGLGYYKRALNIHQAIQIINTEFSGIFPLNYQSILKLPGLGPYTAAAIASIAYDEKVCAIDGNVNRVISRYLEIKSLSTSSNFKMKVRSFMESCLSEATPHLFTQAMMELGALVCTKTKPDCLNCPLRLECKALANQSIQQIPMVAIKKKKARFAKDFVLLRNELNELAISYKHPDDLMQGYARLLERNQISEDLEYTYINHQTHTFTHLVWDCDFYTSTTNSQHYTFVSLDSLKDIPLISLHRKWLNHYLSL